MPAAATVNSLTAHASTPLAPGPGSPDVKIGFQNAWRAVPSGLASAIEGASNAVKSFMSKPSMTPADAAADIAQISSGLVEVGAQGAANGAPGAAGAASGSVSAVNTANGTLAATWATASAAPGGMAPATTAYTEGIKAAVGAASAAVFSALAGVADLHVCPLPVPPMPHGPGMVTQGSNSVLINNLPACRVGDKVFEACGGQDPITMGVNTVLIGDSGGGGGGGGGGTATAKAAAESEAAPAAAPVNDPPADQVGPLAPAGDEEQAPTWLGVVLRDFDRRPIPGEPLTVTLDNGTVLNATTDADGRARFEGLRPGAGEIVFNALSDQGRAEAGRRGEDPSGESDEQQRAARRRGRYRAPLDDAWERDQTGDAPGPDEASSADGEDDQTPPRYP